MKQIALSKLETVRKLSGYLLKSSLDQDVPESVRSKLSRCDSDEWLVSGIELDSETSKPLLLDSSPFIRSKCSFYGKSRLRKVSPNYEGNIQGLEHEGNIKTNEQQLSHESIDDASNHRVSEIPFSHPYGLATHLNSTPPRKNSPVVYSSTPRIYMNGKSAGQPSSRISGEEATVTSQDKPGTNIYLTAPTVNVAGQNVLTSAVSAQHPAVDSCGSHLEKQTRESKNTQQQKERLPDDELLTLNAINSSSKNREILGLSVLDKSINLPRSRYSLACLPISVAERRPRTRSLSKEEPYNILDRDKTTAFGKVSQQQFDVSSQRRHVNTLSVSNKSSQTPAVPLFSSSLRTVNPKVRSSKNSRYENTADFRGTKTRRESSPCSQLHFV
ncbi:uncharacterized protein LOC111083798 [Limulus polyphemus]|uniref:Uncharacterized protein LOC111083798 n=1 Tax=Limulus polyphemus TaxID=6850 RepID=A0ABM1RXU6_LIMPO|nr:uncharacterized protein LOC111083798 [Limulus polyphemus]